MTKPSKQTAKEFQIEISRLRELIHQTDNEPIILPADVSMAYTADRPELLRIVNRSMDEKEVKAVLDVLAGEMRYNQLRKDMITYQDQYIDWLEARIVEAARVVNENLRSISK